MWTCLIRGLWAVPCVRDHAYVSRQYDEIAQAEATRIDCELQKSEDETVARIKVCQEVIEMRKKERDELLDKLLEAEETYTRDPVHCRRPDRTEFEVAFSRLHRETKHLLLEKKSSRKRIGDLKTLRDNMAIKKQSRDPDVIMRLVSDATAFSNKFLAVDPKDAQSAVKKARKAAKDIATLKHNTDAAKQSNEIAGEMLQEALDELEDGDDEANASDEEEQQEEERSSSGKVEAAALDALGLKGIAIAVSSSGGGSSSSGSAFQRALEKRQRELTEGKLKVDVQALPLPQASFNPKRQQPQPHYSTSRPIIVSAGPSKVSMLA